MSTTAGSGLCAPPPHPAPACLAQCAGAPCVARSGVGPAGCGLVRGCLLRWAVPRPSGGLGLGWGWAVALIISEQKGLEVCSKKKLRRWNM